MIRHESTKSKEEIKRVIFENKAKLSGVPFEPSPLLGRITAEKTAESKPTKASNKQA